MGNINKELFKEGEKDCLNFNGGSSSHFTNRDLCYTKFGLPAILVFVGVKMGIVDFFKIPVEISLIVIVFIMAIAMSHRYCFLKRKVMRSTHNVISKIIRWVPMAVLLFSCQTENQRTLLWSDEFNYTGQPDTTKWNYDLGDGCPNVCGWGNNESEFYTKDFKNVRVENDRLIIEAHKDSLGGKPYTSTRIVSKLKGDWLYGRIEVKAKLPRGKGTWPAIWMLSTDWKYGGWPESGEIDIMEHVGHDPGVIHGTIHTKAYNHIKKTQKEGMITISDAQDKFHLYAIDWSENKIDFYVDDILYHSVSKGVNDTFKEWPFDQRFHLIMNIAVGGFWGGAQGIDDSIWPQKMEIDYVRVYQ